ncbi:MAG: hypothetical protein M3Q48_16465, partial [Actinomycetota bacterium]|nr:hypothetical protein [Actinomycetota bacterium]
MAVSFAAAAQVPADADVLGVPVFAGLRRPDGATPWPAPLRPEHLGALGFEGKRGQAQSMVAGDGRLVVAVGMGEPERVDAETFRRGAACLVRAAWKAQAVATTLLDAAPA